MSVFVLRFAFLLFVFLFFVLFESDLDVLFYFVLCVYTRCVLCAQSVIPELERLARVASSEATSLTRKVRLCVLCFVCVCVFLFAMFEHDI